MCECLADCVGERSGTFHPARNACLGGPGTAGVARAFINGRATPNKPLAEQCSVLPDTLCGERR